MCHRFRSPSSLLSQPGDANDAIFWSADDENDANCVGVMFRGCYDGTTFTMFTELEQQDGLQT